MSEASLFQIPSLIVGIEEGHKIQHAEEDQTAISVAMSTIQNRQKIQHAAREARASRASAAQGAVTRGTTGATSTIGKTSQATAQLTRFSAQSSGATLSSKEMAQSQLGELKAEQRAQLYQQVAQIGFDLAGI